MAVMTPTMHKARPCTEEKEEREIMNHHFPFLTLMKSLLEIDYFQENREFRISVDRHHPQSKGVLMTRIAWSTTAIVIMAVVYMAAISSVNLKSIFLPHPTSHCEPFVF